MCMNKLGESKKEKKNCEVCRKPALKIALHLPKNCDKINKRKIDK